MRCYLITTGIVFGLIVIAHIWRLAAEGMDHARNPMFAVMTLLAAGLSIWAFRLLMKSTKP